MQHINKYFIWCLCAISLSNCQHWQSSPAKNQNDCVFFDYELLTSYKVAGSEIIVEDSIALSLWETKDFYARKVTLDPKRNIHVTFFDQLEGAKPAVDSRNVIQLFDNVYKIDSLFFLENFNSDSPAIVNTIGSVYEFNFYSKKLIAFYFQDLSYPITFPNCLILMFDITDPVRVKYIYVGKQASENLNCFGDFDNNGVLDYAKWTFGRDFVDTVKCYQLVNDEFILTEPKKYLKVDRLERAHIVCKSKSDWFDTPLFK